MFLLIAFLFSVVCYAAPPPEKVSCPIANDVGYVAQDIQNINVVAEFEFMALNVQEVTFVDIGNSNEGLCLSTAINDFSMLPEVYCAKGVIMNRNIVINYRYLQNKQNSNYGYPFGADYNV